LPAARETALGDKLMYKQFVGMRTFLSLVLVAAAAGPSVAGSDGASTEVYPFVARIQERMEWVKAFSTSATARTDASSPENWQQEIDELWGPGLPTEQKLAIFDQFWTIVDRHSATFQGIEVNWRGLRDRYRPEIAAGVSRGRFAAIMNHISLALRESHTQATDSAVNLLTPPVPGVPLFAIGPWFQNSFGACATAQSDGTALIIDVVPGQPLGIERGDRVLGFDGRPWTELYPELIAAELPLFPFWWGSSPSSYDHTFVASAPLNWHLFRTIDVAKFRTGKVEHLSTAPLVGGPISAFCTEQMDVAGVPKPQILNDFNDVVSWGIVPDTRVGYIYVWGWYGNAETGFTQAIRELTQEQQTDGLIIDFRFNLGGDMFLSNEGLNMLFRRPTFTVWFDARARDEPHNHFAMTHTFPPPARYAIDGGPRNPHDPAYYDKPIAVLTGPGAVSSGDQVALRMTYDPHVRTFGKSTATAFNSPVFLDLDPDWYAAVAFSDAFKVSEPGNYLTHDEFVVDEPVWLTPSDVAEGRDTVVEAALQWISSQ
jgi:hypothetical protein